MKRAIFQVNVGPPNPLYEVCMASVLRYCERHDIAHIAQLEPELRIRPLASRRSAQAVSRLGYLPIYEKENAFHYLGTFDQIAIVDADIFIRDDAPNIFDIVHPASCFAGVLERDMPLTPQYAQKIKAYSQAQYGPLLNEAPFPKDERGIAFFNMGLMVLTTNILPYLEGQTPEEFIRRPEFARFVNGEGAWRWSTDQTLLNYWVRRTRMQAQVLSWRWNALFKGVKDSVLGDAYFIHFFLSSLLPNQGRDVEKIIAQIERGDLNFSWLKGRG